MAAPHMHGIELIDKNDKDWRLKVQSSVCQSYPSGSIPKHKINQMSNKARPGHSRLLWRQNR